MLEIKDQEQEYVKLSDRVRKIAIVLFFIVLLIFVYIFLFYGNKNQNSITEPKNLSASTDLTVDEQISALKRRSKLSVPTPSSRKEISSKDLPLEILNILGSNPQYLSVYLNSYNTGVQGFELELLYPKSVTDAYFSLLSSFRKEKWLLLYGSRYEESGILNMENGEYTNTITFEKIDDNSTKIKVLIISKK